MRGYLMAMAGLALAACAGGEVAGVSPAVVGGGRGLPETRAEARPDLMTPPGRRDLGLAVRAFVPREDGTFDEVAGASCLVQAGAFSATMATPGRLVIPDLGPDAPVVRADCRGEGRLGAAQVAPVFAWPEAGGSEPERVAWGGGWWFGGMKTGPMRYPDLSVSLREPRR